MNETPSVGSLVVLAGFVGLAWQLSRPSTPFQRKQRKWREFGSSPAQHHHMFESDIRHARNALDAALSVPCGSRRVVLALDALESAAQAQAEHLAVADRQSKEAAEIAKTARQAILTCSR